MSNKAALKHLGRVTSKTYTIAEEIAEHLDELGHEMPHYGSPYNGPVMHGFVAGGAEHGTGRAIDVMVMSPGAIGDAVAAFVWANRSRYDLQHVIWKQRIKSTKVSPGKWRGMSDRGSPTENHMDHPHILTGTGASVKGSAKRPTRRATHYYQPSGVDMSVKAIQKAVGVKADGYYGVSTKAAVKDLQDDLGVTADGLWGPDTEKAYKAKGKPSPSKPKPTRSPATGRAPRFPLPKGWYFGPRSGPRASVSGYHGHRADLKKWQAQMLNRGWGGIGKADGLYGDKTATVARQFQQEKRLGVDGLIGAKTWSAAWEADIT